MAENVNNNCGFSQGWDEAKQRLADLKNELKKVLDAKTEAAWGLYKNGKVKMGYAKMVMVQQVFEKYGIDNPFGK